MSFEIFSESVMETADKELSDLLDFSAVCTLSITLKCNH